MGTDVFVKIRVEIQEIVAWPHKTNKQSKSLQNQQGLVDFALAQFWKDKLQVDVARRHY